MTRYAYERLERGLSMPGVFEVGHAEDPAAGAAGPQDRLDEVSG